MTTNRSCILAFDSVTERGEIRLESFDGEVFLRAELIAAHGDSRTNLLTAIAEALAVIDAEPKDVGALIVCRGPGRFTAARTACVIANAFASAQKTPLYPLDATEYHAESDPLSALITRFSDRRADRAEPLFESPPRITLRP